MLLSTLAGIILEWLAHRVWEIELPFHFVFFIFVSFLVATWASVGAIIYSWNIDTIALVLNWESWWIALFFQIVLGSGLLLLASHGLKIKSGLEPEIERW